MECKQLKKKKKLLMSFLCFMLAFSLFSSHALTAKADTPYKRGATGTVHTGSTGAGVKNAGGGSGSHADTNGGTSGVATNPWGSEVEDLWSSMETYTKDLSPFQKACYELFAGCMKALRDSVSPNQIKSWLKFGDKPSYQAAISGIVSTVFLDVRDLALGMLIIYFLIHLNKEVLTNGREFTLFTLYAPLLKFGIGAVVIFMGDKIMSAVLSINDAFIDLVGQSISEASTAEMTQLMQFMHDYMKDLSFLACVGYLPGFLISWLTSILISLVIIYFAVSRTLEILVRVAFAPIALGDVFNGEQSNAIRYIKKVVGLILWGGLMMVVVYIGSQLQSMGFNDIIGKAVSAGSNFSIWDISFIGGWILFPLATAGLLSGLKQASNDLLGV